MSDVLFDSNILGKFIIYTSKHTDNNRLKNFEIVVNGIKKSSQFKKLLISFDEPDKKFILWAKNTQENLILKK